MAGFLDRVLEHKINEIAERMSARPLASFKDQISPGKRSFEGALSEQGFNIIAEIKPRSPALGKLEGSISLDSRMSIYNQHAKAISVLCDQKFFDGSIELLREVSMKCSRPTLCKDFVVHAYQVYEARHAGAEAVLLICKLISQSQMSELFQLTLELGMTPVVEVQNEEEMIYASELGTKVILINNRDLQTLEIDLTTTSRLAQLAPANAIVIAASGVDNRGDLLSLRPYASNFLIGSAFMKASDPGAKFLEFFESDRTFVLQTFIGRRTDSVEGNLISPGSEDNSSAECSPFVKICGICNFEDAEVATKSGAELLGFIFAESARKVDVEHAQSIISNLRTNGLLKAKMVGVFRNQSTEEIVEISEKLNLDAIQLHGAESPAQIAEIKKRCSQPKHPLIIKAVELDPQSTCLFSSSPEDYSGLVDLFLFDRPKTLASDHDWLNRILNGFRDQLQSWRPFLFAGGVNENNIEQVLNLHPAGIDIASGVERDPRQKDHNKLKSFFDKLKGAVTC